MTEIKKGLYVCPKFGFGINMPADLSKNEEDQELLVQSAGIIAGILDDCKDLGRIYHDPYCPPNCPIQNLVDPLNELLGTKK